MKRDFSESAYEKLLSLVKEVEDEQWCAFTDWVGDGWYGFQSWTGNLNIKKYVDDVNKYHKKVIDKNDASAKDIESIFTNVNGHNTNYFTRFTAALTDIQMFCELVKGIAGVVSPGNGQFNADFIGNGLKGAINTYLKSSDILQVIAGDGLSSEDANKYDPNALQMMLERLGSTLISLCPNVGANQRYEIPIGPDTTFYYEVEVEGDVGNNVGIGAVIEDQRIKIQKVSAETDGKLTAGTEYEVDGTGKISVNSDSSGVSIDTNGQLEGTASVQVGNSTYTVTIKTSTNEITCEQSVTTEVEGGSVTTKVGITKKNNPNWEPVPVPVPVEVPYPGTLPQIIHNPAWQDVGEIIIIGYVAYVVVYAGVAIYTGGASTTVMPPPIPIPA